MSTEFLSLHTDLGKTYDIEVTRNVAHMRGLPAELNGKRFAHLTDFHAGYGGTAPVFEKVVERVNAFDPDFIFLTGDYRDDHATDLDFPIAAVLRRLRSRYGTFASIGNHEHRRGITESFEVLKDAGVTLLYNANVQHETGLWIVGIDDLTEGNPYIEAAFRGVPNDRSSLVLSHNPGLIQRIPERDAQILSGHTHGGQIVLPFLPNRLVIKVHLGCNQVAGWYRNDKSRLYVSRGVGVTGKPFRYRCPAEIALWEFAQADE